MAPLNLLPALEALLFSSDQPLPLTLLAESLDAEPAAVAEALHELGQSYAARGAGVELREIAGGWLFTSAPGQSEYVQRMLRGKKKMRLSRAALETMAIIAYKQPVTKTEVEAIRGVDSTGVMTTLLERNRVTIRGRSKVVGRPLLYGTTQEFLDYFGLKELAELPRPEELRALVAAREPEQLEMMELEVVSQVASDLAASGLVEPREPHAIEPLGGDDVGGETLDAPFASDAFQVASDRETAGDDTPAGEDDDDPVVHAPADPARDRA